MRNDPEKLLRRRLERAMRVSRVRGPMRTVHRWRGKRYVVKLRMVIRPFMGTGVLPSERPARFESFRIYEAEFGVR